MRRRMAWLLMIGLLAAGCSGPGGAPTMDAVARQMALNTSAAQTRAVAGTPQASPQPSPTAQPTSHPSPRFGTSTPEPKPTSSQVPEPLPPLDLPGNLLENGTFQDLSGWDRAGTALDAEGTALVPGVNYVMWERTGSRRTGRSLGVQQPLELDVSRATRVDICLDVWVGYHSLRNTGWFAESRGGINEMPVHILIDYLDRVNNEPQTWHHGFLVHHDRSTDMTNYTIVPEATWRRFCFDLMDDGVRRDPYGREILPRPGEIRRILLFGNGWDFRGAVGNAILTVSP